MCFGSAGPVVDTQIGVVALPSILQGVGRLIRDYDDRGVVVICDPRISSKGYGRKFLASLPPFPVTHDVTRAENFLIEQVAAV